jgi:hypothetical protein
MYDGMIKVLKSEIEEKGSMMLSPVDLKIL